jgi:Putative Ig domain
MKQAHINSWILTAVALAVAAANSGCGGGSTAAPPPPPLAISVGVSPAGAQTVDQGQTKNFTATVSNDSSNKGVTWSLMQNGTVCSPGCGTIAPANTPSGQPATYTAPAAINANLQFSITATSVADTTKSAADQTFAVPPPALNNSAALPTATVGQAYSYQLTENGGVPPFTWSITSGSLPAGLTLNQNTGLVSGTPTSAVTLKDAMKPTGATASGVQVCFTVQVVDSGNPPLLNSQQLCINVAAASNPVPTLTSISPSTAPPGAGPLLLDIFGGNFVSGATVGFGTDTLTPSIVTAGEIIVTIPAADLAATGSVAVTVTNPAPGGGTSNQVMFTVVIPPISVTVSLEQACSTTGVPFNGTCFVYANVANDPKVLGVTWSLSGPTCTGGACGTILPGGGHPFDDRNPFAFYALYFGPDNKSNFPSTVTATATSLADPTKSNSTTIALTSTPPSIGIVSPLITANAAGTTGASGDSNEPAINLDGGYVAFTSAAQDLGFSITQPTQVFWKSTCVGQPADCVPLGTIMVAFNAQSTNGGEGNHPSSYPSISSDGQVVGFFSAADNLDPTITKPVIGQNAFAATECGVGHCVVPPPHMISVDNLGNPSGGGVGTISPDGRWMAFQGGPEILEVTPSSAGTQFPSGVYVGDACTGTAAPPCVFGTVSYVSTDNNGNPDNGGGGIAVASQVVSPVGPNAGGFVVFNSGGTNLVPGVTGGQSEIYERDLGLGRTFLISQDNSGNPALGPGGAVVTGVSYDGRFVSFLAAFDPSDTSGRVHLYVRDTCFNAVSCTPTTTLVDVATVGPTAGKPSTDLFWDIGQHMISADGRYVVFVASDEEFTTHTDPINGGHLAVFVKDMSCKAISDCPNGGVHLVSVTSSNTSIFPDESGFSISGDGHYVVFTTFGGPAGPKYRQLLLALTGF